MKNTKTIDEKRNELEKALSRLNAFETLINRCEEAIRWYMDCDPETGEMIAPNEESYNYEQYTALSAALDEIRALV